MREIHHYNRSNPLSFTKPTQSFNKKHQTTIAQFLHKNRDLQSYSEILLHEYQALVSTLSQLDEPTFKAISIEVNAVVDKLIKWFDETTADHTLSIYWAMRNLKQKARKKLSSRHSPQKGEAEELHIIDYLISR